jgi:hypothetical protein
VFTAGFTLGYASKAYEADASSFGGSTAAANTVNVSQQSPPSTHPLAAVSGLFANDPLWQEYLKAIEEIRNEDEALEDFAG